MNIFTKKLFTDNPSGEQKNIQVVVTDTSSSSAQENIPTGPQEPAATPQDTEPRIEVNFFCFYNEETHKAFSDAYLVILKEDKEIYESKIGELEPLILKSKYVVSS